MFALAMLRRLVFAVLTLVASASIVLAQAPAPGRSGFANPSPSASSIALARELLELKGGKQMFDGMVTGVIDTAKNSFVPNNPNLSRPLSEVATQLRTEFDAKKSEVFNEVARAYARYFTEQEMREMLAFYKTTLGRKVLSSESVAVEDGFKRAQEWSNQFSDQVLTRFRAEMKKRGHDL
jgi:uncharacterized protein